MPTRSSQPILIIGAGIGGLTAAAVLARAGLDVTVLEAHVYPGGCAGTFYHKGYRFDAGATLAGGFYRGGPMELVAHAAGIAAWPLVDEPPAAAPPGGAPSNTPHSSADHSGAAPAMIVHLPDGQAVARYGGARRWAEHERAFGPASLSFWRWQEATADALWELALRTPPWPPQTPGEALRLAQTGLRWLAAAPGARLRPALLADALRPVAAHLQGAPANLRALIDAQLLISAQTTSAHANALYGASALDLPRRGVVHLRGGMGAIARTLAQAVNAAGGQVLYRHEVTGIQVEQGRVTEVQTRRGRFAAGTVIANLPPWNIARLLGEAAPARLRQLPAQEQAGWGAFMLYVGLDAAAVPADFPLHHQVIVRQPLGEGNSLFLSLSPASDPDRAPAGRRALTISTHTLLTPWWQLHSADPAGYAARRQHYVEQMLAGAERALPGLRNAAHLVLPGTPVTFQRFTRRERGWVGGFAQTSLLTGWGPRLRPGLWMVGDSIFPGQSTAAVALGGLRVAQGVLSEYNSQA